nr:hypothetical protein Iba_chr10bCG10030 [Ipomoea batatas]GMD47223.1 hypothetical protein Iba_chr10eCG10840 [Ipomoea batatas]GMD48585.1 hypothetical protein Iba_chr10fCG7760 [Ipomoea batatas]
MRMEMLKSSGWIRSAGSLLIVERSLLSDQNRQRVHRPREYLVIRKGDLRVDLGKRKR